MMKNKDIFLWILLVSAWLILTTFSVQLWASEMEPNQNDLLGIKSNTKNFSLFDPQRLKLNHSYTFSYFSNSRYSGSMGIYTTTLNYQIAKPLSLTLSLNYLHQPLSVFGHSNLTTKDGILPNFQLHYRPSSNFSLWINVTTFSSPSNWGYGNLWRESYR